MPKNRIWDTTSMSDVTALLDTNVLYPAPIRDILLQLAVEDLFRAKWTIDIHREWVEAFNVDIMSRTTHLDKVKVSLHNCAHASNTSGVNFGSLSTRTPCR